MDNRTIRRAVTRRVPEIYFIDAPVHVNNRVAWLMMASINGRPYKIIADMPKTSLVSHNELLTTMVSELYDEVSKIKRGAKFPEMVPEELGYTPLTAEELEVFNTPDGNTLIEDSKRKIKGKILLA
jgi:hypothetical protein